MQSWPFCGRQLQVAMDQSLNLLAIKSYWQGQFQFKPVAAAYLFITFFSFPKVCSFRWQVIYSHPAKHPPLDGQVSTFPRPVGSQWPSPAGQFTPLFPLRESWWTKFFQESSRLAHLPHGSHLVSVEMDSFLHHCLRKCSSVSLFSFFSCIRPDYLFPYQSLHSPHSRESVEATLKLLSLGLKWEGSRLIPLP